ncbi:MULTISPECIES: hypothetical protein [unclassified Kitasatospora]|uniref:hypothetical protein n=1 Tax=Kitasatospora sp. NPDC001603 TaxID=3154388 RepID=UPI003330D5D3
MSENTPDSKGPAPATLGTAATQPSLVRADQVKPEDIATLAIEYRDGVPVIVASGGTFVPATVRVEDSSGNVARSAAYVGSQLTDLGFTFHKDVSYWQLDLDIRPR